MGMGGGSGGGGFNGAEDVSWVAAVVEHDLDILFASRADARCREQKRMPV